jgi:hypothetical protein
VEVMKLMEIFTRRFEDGMHIKTMLRNNVKNGP